MLRSALALTIGVLVLTLVSFAIEFLTTPLLFRAFHLTNPSQIGTHPWARLVLYVYTALAIAAGGFVAASIARRQPILHSAILGLAQAGLTIMAMYSFPELSTTTNWIVLTLLSFPAAVAGGVFRSRLQPGER